MAFSIASDSGALILSLADAKAHLRVEVSDDDALITALIHAAREKIEKYTNLALTLKTVHEYFDAFPDSTVQRPNAEFLLSVNRVASITSVQYYEDVETDVLTTIASTDYLLDNTSMMARLAPRIGVVWPLADGRINSVKIVYQAGYATVAEIPASILQAAKLMIGDWYERREDRLSQGQSTGFIIPRTSELLLNPYRIYQWT